jgi:hypothetical protein
MDVRLRTRAVLVIARKVGIRRIATVSLVTLATASILTSLGLAPAYATGSTSSTLTATADPTSVVTGQPVQLSATVSGGSGTPTGTLTFYGSTSFGPYVLCSAEMSSGTGACVATNLITQSGYPVTVTYSGDSTYAPISSDDAALTVGPAETTLTLTASSNPSTSQPLTFTATVGAVPPATMGAFPQTLSPGSPQVIFTVDPGTQQGHLLCQDAGPSPDPAVENCTAYISTGRHVIEAQLYGGDGYDGATAELTQVVEPPPDQAYWLAEANGGVYSNGADIGYWGAASSRPLNHPIVGMASTPDGAGYWLVASDGGIFAYGDASFYGSTGGIALNKPIVGMASTPDGAGYWLVASDGGIFAYGDAQFYGSTGGIALNKPIVGMATPNGHGYWLVSSDGGIFAFGDAEFYGSTGGIALNKPIVGMASTPDGAGYWLVASDGGIFTYGDALFSGTTGTSPPATPIVGIAAAP